MRVMDDCFGRSVRPSDERLNHIREHPEMIGLVDKIETVLRHPELVRVCKTDMDARLSYRYYLRTMVGDRLALRCG